ncbi:MAG TPA: DUF4232 domain-containing protein [Jatrophihabitans sp.]|nr:DUF4232 domain-containing protein [Jatrophihabitans sp.]
MRPVLVLLGLLGLLAGCGSATGPSAAGPSVPDSAAVTSSDTSDPSADATNDPLDPTDLVGPPSPSGFVTGQPRTSAAQPSTVSPPPAGLLACGPPYLRLAVRSAGSGLSHAGYVLLFTNTGQIACTMTGYPTLTILDGQDRPVVRASPTPSGYLGGLRNPKPPFPTAVLGPGGTASALLEGLLFDSRTGKGCPTQHALLSTPPGTASPIKAAAVTTVCSQVQIHPVVAGNTGSQP